MKPLPDKKQIIGSIAKVARQLGHTPSILEFAAHAEFSRSSLFLIFPKWNEAVRAAGLKPNRLYVRPTDGALLKDWGETVRKKRALPSRWAYRQAGKYYPVTLAKRFGGWESVPQAFRSFAKGKREWRDVLALLPDPPQRENRIPLGSCRGALQRVPGSDVRTSSKASHCKRLKDRATYGNPIHLQGFRNEPVNEHGVMILFGMLAKDLGFVIEAVQKEFPDCEARRQIVPGRWQRVLIEFEFESKNFHNHGHPLNGCDLIVCWRHNWPECPKHIEVLELSRVIKSLAGSDD